MMNRVRASGVRGDRKREVVSHRQLWGRPFCRVDYLYCFGPKRSCDGVWTCKSARLSLVEDVKTSLSVAIL